MANYSHIFSNSCLNAKIKLIFKTPHDSSWHSGKDLAKRMKISLFLGLLPLKLVLFFVFILAPLAAEASFFSFVSHIFNSKNEETVKSTKNNSQNMALLQATVNADPNSGKGGGDITIVGGTALLPETGPTGTMADIKENNFGDQINIYVVRQGDSLSQIAKMFGVSVNTIIWGNEIKGSTIIPGQTLIILPVSGVKHTVKAGDTVRSIAAAYKGDVDEILQFNNLSLNSALSIGEVVIIPDGEVAVSHITTPGATSNVHGTGGPSYVGYYARPVIGAVKTQGLHGYNGIDLGAPVGTPIYASAAGDVLISRTSGWNGGYGQYVVISHLNGTQTLYAHMSQNVAFEGAKVFQGQLIGYVGATGKSTGPHLHFEVRGAKNPF